MDNNSNLKSELYQHFSLEAPELLNTIEEALLNLQKNDNNQEQVRTLMRATHTIKSIAATLELETIKNIAHTLEDAFRAIQTSNIILTSEMKALFFEGYECLRDPLMAELLGSSINYQIVEERASFLLSQLQEKLGVSFVEEPEALNLEEVSFESIKMLLEDSIEPEIEKTSAAIINAKPKEVTTILRATAELFRGYAEAIGIRGFGNIAIATIAALDNHPRQARTIARLALEDFRNSYIDILAGNNSDSKYPSPALQQLAENVATENPTSSPLPFCPLILKDIDTSPATPLPKIVRVNIDHLEQLNYLNAELLTNQNRQFLQDGKMRSHTRKLLSRLRQFLQLLSDSHDINQHSPSHAVAIASKNSDDSFDVLELDSYNGFNVFINTLVEEASYLEQEIDTLEQLNRQTTQLLKKQQKLLTNSRDVLLEARMLPLSNVLKRLHPVLKQLQTLHCKPINLTIEGAEVLVDKAIAERLYEPLLHLVRNSFDHGIESPDIRQQRGKPATGQIKICAYYRGSQLIIDVYDDGKGLDFDGIRLHAVQRGLMTADIANTLNESQLAEILFEPGFSTTNQVNDLSGRGVGLDVVQVQLQAIQGTVAVRTESQKGTTFSLQIPLSLSISKLLVCQAGKKVYALAADTIDQILLPKHSQIQHSEHGRILRLTKTNTNKDENISELIPIYRLSSILDYSTHQPTHITTDSPISENHTVLPLLIVPYEDQLLALEVDRIIWEQELVIRPFSKLVPTPTYVYGGTILADGQLALVINGAALLEHILNQEMQVVESWKHPFHSVQSKFLPTKSNSQPALPLKVVDKKRTVMIVDDSTTLRHALLFTLQKAGYQTIQARDGDEALLQIKHHCDVDLIICDIEMPKMNGFEFLAHCTSDNHLSQIPILILSSRTALKHRQLALKLGASSYLTKPYSEQQLLLTMAQLLSTTKRNPVSFGLVSPPLQPFS